MPKKFSDSLRCDFYIRGMKKRGEKINHDKRNGSSNFILIRGQEPPKNMKVETSWLTEGVRRQLSQFFIREKKVTK